MGVSPMQHSMSRAFNGGRKRLLLWTGATEGSTPSVRFREARGVLDEEVACGWTLAVGAADLDGDLLPEIYFANDFGPDRLLHNRSTPGSLRFALLEGRKTLTTPSSKVLGRDSFKGMGVDFGDLNGDGHLDIFVSNIAAEYVLEESHFVFLSTGEPELMREGVAPYVDRERGARAVAERVGLGREARRLRQRRPARGRPGARVHEGDRRTAGPSCRNWRWATTSLLDDPRNWPRFQPGDDLSGHHGNRSSRTQDQKGRFWDIAAELGLAEPGVSRGIATADVDGDGRLDFAVANQWAPSTFYRNSSPDPGDFLGLHLLLPVGEPIEAATRGPARPPRRRPAGPSRRRGVARPCGCPTDGPWWARSTAATATRAAAAPTSISAWAGSPGTASLTLELSWRDARGPGASANRRT